jgi:hypothetical protein
MTLKSATKIVIAGASLSVVLGILSLLARLIDPLARILYVSGEGVVIGILYILVSVSYLVFFVTLSSKQT